MDGIHGYLAGMIDGEGTITIHKHPQHRRQTMALRPRLIVSNTHHGVLLAIVGWYGGTIIEQPLRPGHRRAYLWRCCGMDHIQRTVTAIRPWLIIKAERADLMLEFLAIRADRGRQTYGEREFAIYKRIAELNNRLLPKPLILR